MRCFKAGAMDFDDLLFQTNRLLRDHPDVLLKYQHKFRYIMVDGVFSGHQFFPIRYHPQARSRLRETFAGRRQCPRVFMLFRGASSNILNFQKDYPDSKVFKLEQNYQSTKTIVHAAR
jgi:DNA helicase-2/ATP-dependent DNA helicase PcrA